MSIEIYRVTAPLAILAALTIVVTSTTAHAADCGMFDTDEILDAGTLDIEILQDWHVDKPTGSTRQKLIEINVAEWWPGQDYRIPVRMIVPLAGKAKGFHITGGNLAEALTEDSAPNAFQSKLLAGGVGIVKTVVKPLEQIPGKQGLEQEMTALGGYGASAARSVLPLRRITIAQAFHRTRSFRAAGIVFLPVHTKMISHCTCARGGMLHSVAPPGWPKHDSQTTTPWAILGAFLREEESTQRQRAQLLEQSPQPALPHGGASSFKQVPIRLEWSPFGKSPLACSSSLPGKRNKKEEVPYEEVIDNCSGCRRDDRCASGEGACNRVEGSRHHRWTGGSSGLWRWRNDRSVADK
jgi:hypothetical protein